MIYVLFLKGEPVHITTESPHTGTPKLKEFAGVEYDEAKCSWEFESLEEVEALAAKFSTDDKTLLGYDCGEYNSPRFGLIEAPKIGDEVSYAFNGDYTPCGTIVKITKGWRITTSDGKVFNRKKKSPGWMMVGGTWRLVAGHHNERNQEF